MTRQIGILPLLILSINSGCVSSLDNMDPYSGHWRLLDGKKKILEEKFDRAKLEELAGKPTIDAGDEWVYVSKFEDWDAIPLDMIMAIYSSGPRPAWKTTVVTFDEAGIVTGIRTSTARSEIYQRKGWWTLMGINFDKHVRVREVPTTQPSTTRPSDFRAPATTRAGDAAGW